MISTIARNITAFILVLILFAHNINTLVVIGDFIVNQDFIAKTFCIQKEDQKGCNGKCHLGKELATTEPGSSSNNPLHETKRMVLDVFCLSNITKVEVPRTYVFSESEKLSIHTPKLTKMYLDIDTPPPNFC